jgi:hypothetical protein
VFAASQSQPKLALFPISRSEIYGTYISLPLVFLGNITIYYKMLVYVWKHMCT